MKRFRLSYQPDARADLDNLYFWIVENQGSTDIADQYLARLEHSIKGLEIFPQRGTRRDDLLPGLRMIGFQRRVAILFKIVDDTVLILRIFYGGRDVAALFNENAALPAGESGDIQANDFDAGD